VPCFFEALPRSSRRPFAVFSAAGEALKLRGGNRTPRPARSRQDAVDPDRERYIDGSNTLEPKTGAAAVPRVSGGANARGSLATILLDDFDGAVRRPPRE
jgi:hypothetical protein